MRVDNLIFGGSVPESSGCCYCFFYALICDRLCGAQ